MVNNDNNNERCTRRCLVLKEGGGGGRNLRLFQFYVVSVQNPVSFMLFLVNFTVGRRERLMAEERNKFKVGSTVAESIPSKGELFSGS